MSEEEEEEGRTQSKNGGFLLLLISHCLFKCRLETLSGHFGTEIDFSLNINMDLWL